MLVWLTRNSSACLRASHELFQRSLTERRWNWRIARYLTGSSSIGPSGELRLHMSGCGDDGVFALTSRTAWRPFVHLRVLDLSACYLSGAGLGHLAPALESCGALETLDLSYNHFESGCPHATTVMVNLRHCPQLSYLDLTRTHCCDATLAVMVESLRYCDKITVLNLRGTRVGPKTVLAFTELPNPIGALCSFELSGGVSLVAPPLLRVLARCPLQRLVLENVKIGPDEIGALRDIYSKRQLTELEISTVGYYNGLQPLGVHLARGWGACPLQVLRCSHNNWGGLQWPRTVCAIAQCTLLDTLDLSANQLGDEDMDVLTTAVATLPLLNVLSLVRNKIHNAGAHRLSTVSPRGIWGLVINLYGNYVDAQVLVSPGVEVELIGGFCYQITVPPNA